MNKVSCNSLDDKQFNSVWELYESSFPELERRTLEMHRKVMGDARFYSYAYYGDSNELMAICFYWHFQDFIYLEHLAVSLEARNRRVGTVILAQITQGNLPVILEIEPPTDRETINRLCFYRNNRFLQTGYQFKQLNYRKGSEDLFLELLCNQFMDVSLYKQFKDTVYKALSPYCE